MTQQGRVFWEFSKTICKSHTNKIIFVAKIFSNQDKYG